MGEGDFTWESMSTAANEGGEAASMMGTAKRASGDRLIGESGERVDFGDFDLFGGGEIG